MPVNYESAVSSLIALGHELLSNRKFDLAHMRRLMEALGNPQRRLQSVLIAGTNGKGSVCAFLRAMLEGSGYSVHVYTSPHLVHFHERIRIAGKLIPEEELAETLERWGIRRCRTT